MKFEDACGQAREISEKYRKEIERELEEQFISGNVAALVAYEVNGAIDRVRHYLQINELCSQGQFLKALEIVLRNRGKSTKEQLEVFSQVPDEPEDNDNQDN